MIKKHGPLRELFEEVYDPEEVKAYVWDYVRSNRKRDALQHLEGFLIHLNKKMEAMAKARAVSAKRADFPAETEQMDCA